MRNRCLALSAAIAAAFLFILAADAVVSGGYDYAAVDAPGLAGTTLGGISDVGVIVGYGRDGNGAIRAFTRSDNTFASVAPPAGQTFTTFGQVNDAGGIVGGISSTADQTIRGFTRTGSNYAVYQYNGTATTTRLDGINDNGDRVGYANPSAGGAPIGLYLPAGASTASVIAPPDATRTFAIGINDGGVIVGQFRDATTTHGFLRSAAGAYAQLDYPGATGTTARAVNDRGDVTGTVLGLANVSAYVYRNGTYSVLSFPGSTTTFVNGINNAGQVVGSFADSAGATHGFVASLVPEPTSPGAIGAAAFALLRRARRRRATR